MKPNSTPALSFSGCTRSSGRILILLALLVTTGTSYACGSDNSGPVCPPATTPATQPVNAAPPLGVGNPIHLITGNKYQEEIDLPALPGVLGLEIVRHYNSSLSGPRVLPGPIGRGWRLSYETELAIAGNAIEVIQADGSKLTFGRDLVNTRIARHISPAHGTISIQASARGDEYTWTWQNGRKLNFNASGKLVQIQAATGEILSLQHDARGLLVRVTDPQGRSLRLSWLDRVSSRTADRFRGVQNIDSPVGRFSYGYGSPKPQGALTDPRILLANLVSVSYPGEGSGRRYHYEDGLQPTLLTGISNEGTADGAKTASNRFATYAYRSDGKAIMSTHADSTNKVTLSYDTPGQTTITNSLGQKTVYRHTEIDNDYRLLEVRGVGCSTCGESDIRYRYDKVGRLLETTKLDNNGQAMQAVRFGLDQLGRPITLSRVAYIAGKPQPEQLEKRHEYGSNDTLALVSRPSVVPGKEATRQFVYNAVGQTLSVSENGWAPPSDSKAVATPIHRITRYRYRTVNGRSVLSTIDGPLANGKTSTPTDSDVTEVEWDATGSRIVSITLPGNFVSNLDYDEAGRLKQVRDAGNHATVSTYNARGRPLTVTANGVSRAITYDAFDNAVETGFSSHGQYRALARFGFDAAGRQVWKASHLGILKQQRYDTEGKLIESSTRSANFNQTEQFGYDEHGRLSTAVDWNGAVRRILWNSQNLPEQTINALGGTARYSYDGTGNLVSVTQDGDPEDTVRVSMTEASGGKISAPNDATTHFIKDDFGRVLIIVSPDSGRSTRHYDAADRIVASTDANGNSASYQYDVSGRVVRQSVIDTSATRLSERLLVTSWTYRGKNLVTLADPNQTEHYEYDAENRLISKTVILKLEDGSFARNTTHYTYDQLGQLTSSSLPDGSRIHYRRNDQNQVIALERSRVSTPWLAWMMPAQPLISSVARDIVGLKHFVYGNGIVAEYQRSAQGNLARIVHARPQPIPALSKSSHLGDIKIGVEPTLAAKANGSEKSNQARPGALALPNQAGALSDRRYLWDLKGNLKYQLGLGEHNSYKYDQHDRLIAAASTRQDNVGAAQQASYARYAYDRAGNRILGQENTGSQADVTTNTVATTYAPSTNRWLGDKGGSKSVNYDGNGQPLTFGKRAYGWNALGKMTEARDAGVVLARYSYNQRGERISKAANRQRDYYFYENGLISAELDARGRIVRQYIYLADLPVAVIDPIGTAAISDKRSPLAQVCADLAKIITTWFGEYEYIAFLHNNHLGAPEVATNAEGMEVWHGEYSPFGSLRRTKPVSSAKKFAQNLRLPGQYADQETGLHYNYHRYYDPYRGRYISSDPLGLRAGSNTYSYVSGNPLKYVDPAGLILFAFDGTGNSENPPPGDTISNVLKFYNAYEQKTNGKAYYITGINTTNVDMPIKGGELNGDGFDARLDLAFNFLDKFVSTNKDTDTINIDVVGFSRGAAEARVWINQLASKLVNQKYTSGGITRCINLRFEGLWDTVPHLGLLNQEEHRYDFSIPTLVKHAVHAVALNEHRGGHDNFDVRSLWKTPGTISTASRIEKAFIGSHSDIGGAYGTGDLSDVAFMWMIDQAGKQNIKFTTAVIKDNGWDTITSPILHDKSVNLREGAGISRSRQVVYGDGKKPKHIKQLSAEFDEIRVADSVEVVDYFENPFNCGIAAFNAGLVDMQKYKKWIDAYGFDIAVSPIIKSPCL